MTRIMLVDDEPQVCVALTRIINSLGESGEFVVVEQKENGKSAMEYLQQAQIDVVITDISMPVMDGIALAKHIMELYPEIVVVFLTGFSDFAYAQQSVRYRVYDYILKPVDKEELLRVLKAAGEEAVRRQTSHISNHLAELQRSGIFEIIYGALKSREIMIAINTIQKDVVCASIKKIFMETIKGVASIKKSRQIASFLVYQLQMIYPQIADGEASNKLLDERLAQCRSAQEIWIALKQNILYLLEQFASKGKTRSHLNEIKAYICKEYSKDISLQMLSDQFELSPNYISEIFREDGGQNFLDYLIEVRLEKAVSLLRQTDLKIYQIAKMVGYNDANYFNKMFKKRIGISPGEFRNKIIK